MPLSYENIFSQFKYCPLVWMRQSRKLNNKLNRLQEKALYVENNDKCSILLLVARERQISDNSYYESSILATQIFTVKIGISPAIMTETFKLCGSASHNVKRGQVLERRHNRTNNFGVESISTLGAKYWALISDVNQSHSTVSGKALTSVTQVTVLVNCVRVMCLKSWFRLTKNSCGRNRIIKY